MGSSKAEAERLKALGNELYQRGEHEAAHHKYSEAIKKDPSNAILYANRAATLIARKEYLDALWDCRKAVELDPTYSRAWGRYGTVTHALGTWPECIRAWEKAIEYLPKTDLTPMHKTMKVQFEGGLAKARAAQNNIQPGASQVRIADIEAGKMFWDLADKVRPRKIAEGKPSCVFSIAYAHSHFKAAMEALDAMRNMKDARGNEGLAGEPVVFECLTNAILIDDRVYVMADPSLPMRLQKQAIFENLVRGGWFHNGGPSVVKEEALKRLKTQGWDGVRPAIAVTVRIWIYSAFFQAYRYGQRQAAHELYTRALDVLEWARNQRSSIPTEDRGTIFQRSFIRGVKRLHLENMHSAMSTEGSDHEFTLQEVIDTAKDLLEDVNSDPPLVQGGQLHLGRHLGYWIYPKASALAVLGWCYGERGGDPSAAESVNLANLKTSAEYYKEGAELCPEDEHLHVGLLYAHLGCLFQMGEPLKVTLPLAKRILSALPQVLEIWNGPPHGEPLQNIAQLVSKFESKAFKAISGGKYTMDDVLLPY